MISNSASEEYHTGAAPSGGSLHPTLTDHKVLGGPPFPSGQGRWIFL